MLLQCLHGQLVVLRDFLTYRKVTVTVCLLTVSRDFLCMEAIRHPSAMDWTLCFIL